MRSVNSRMRARGSIVGASREGDFQTSRQSAVVARAIQITERSAFAADNVSLARASSFPRPNSEDTDRERAAARRATSWLPMPRITGPAEVGDFSLPNSGFPQRDPMVFERMGRVHKCRTLSNLASNERHSSDLRRLPKSHFRGAPLSACRLFNEAHLR